MQNTNKIAVQIEKENNINIILKITTIKPIIETLKNYYKEDTKDIKDINKNLENLLKKDHEDIIKNIIDDIITVYEDELSEIIEDAKYNAAAAMYNANKYVSAEDVLNDIELTGFDDIELI